MKWLKTALRKTWSMTSLEKQVLRKEKAKVQVGQVSKVLSFVAGYACWRWMTRMCGSNAGIIKMKIAVEDLSPIAEAPEAKQQVIVKVRVPVTCLLN